MRVCHVSSAHFLEGGRIFNRACKGLVKEGHSVTLIINPNEEFMGTKIIDGVKVIPLKRRKGRMRRIQAAYEAYRLCLEQEADIFHFHDPDLIPFMLKLRKRGNHVVFDSHEHFSEVLKLRFADKNWGKMLGAIYHLCQKKAVSRLSGLIGVTDRMIDVIGAHGVARCPVGNFVNRSLFEDRVLPKKVHPRILATTGIISVARHCDQLIAALPLILDRHDDIVLRLSGEFSPPDYDRTARHLASAYGVEEHVELLGYVTYRENIERAAQATIGCAFFDPAPHAVVTLQNRLFEYMFCGVPVMVTKESGVMEEIVREVKCGLVVNSLDPSSIAAGACQLLEDPVEAAEMGRRGRKAVLEKYNFDVALDAMIEFYKGIVSERPVLS